MQLVPKEGVVTVDSRGYLAREGNQESLAEWAHRVPRETLATTDNK